MGEETNVQSLRKTSLGQGKTALENIIRSAPARITATTLHVLEPLCFEETGEDCATVTFNLVVSATSYKLSQQQQLKKHSSFIWMSRI